MSMEQKKPALKDGIGRIFPVRNLDASVSQGHPLVSSVFDVLY